MPDPYRTVYGRLNKTGPSALRRRRHFVQQAMQPSNPGAGAWPAAYAQIATSPATWLALGDSSTEGQGASQLGKRWISQCLNLLRAHPASPSLTGGVGWLASASLVVGPDSAWTSPTSPIAVAGGAATVYNYFWQTLDGKAGTTNALNDTITWTAKGTSVDTWVVDSSAAGTYQIDSNAAVVLANGGNFPALQVQRASMGSSTSHTIQIKQTNAGLIGVDGIFVYDGDESNGVHLWGNGHYGALTTDLLGDWGTGGFDTFLKPFWAQQVAPDAVTIGFGTNEFLNNIDPATFKVSMRQVVRLLQALPKIPTIYLLAMPTYDDGVTQTFRWTVYQAALSALAQETSGVVYVDVSVATGAPTVGGNFSTDRIHPSDAGHALIGQYMAPIMGGPFAGSFTSTGTAAMSATGAVGKVGTASLTGTASVATAATLGVVGAASPAGTASIATAQTLGAVGAATLTSTAAMTATGVVGKVGAATLTATAGMLADAGSFVGAATLTGTAGLTATGVVGAVGAASLTGTASTATAATLGAVGAVSATATAAMTATGVVGVVGAMSSTITAAMAASSGAQATLTATAGLTATGAAGAVGTLTSTAAGAIATAQTLGAVGAVTSTATAAASTAGTLGTFGGLSATSTASVVTVAAVGAVGALSATGTAGMAAAGVVGKVGQASLAGSAVVATSQTLGVVGQASLAGTAVMLARPVPTRGSIAPGTDRAATSTAGADLAPTLTAAPIGAPTLSGG